MELEEAVKKLELMEYKYTLTGNDDKAIETVLTSLENSIPKKKIEDKIKEIKEEHKKQLTIETLPSHTFSLRQEDGIFGDVLKVLQELLEE